MGFGCCFSRQLLESALITKERYHIAVPIELNLLFTLKLERQKKKICFNIRFNDSPYLFIYFWQRGSKTIYQILKCIDHLGSSQRG